MEEVKKEELFSCPYCGLHYRKRADSERCEKWCEEHNSCNLEIIRKSVEREEG